MFKRKKSAEPKEKKKEGKRTSKLPKMIVLTGWAVLFFSVGVGLYNNFTAVSTHTVHEKEVIKETLVDTTGLQSYVKGFSQTYFTVSPLSKDQQEQQERLKSYLADNVMLSSSFYKEVKEKVVVKSVDIVEIKAVPEEKNVYSVSMKLSLESNSKVVVRSYSVDVYAKDNAFAVVKLPVLATLPDKATIKVESKLPSSSVEAKTRENVEGFLETFFTVYPKADEKELIYYGKNLQPIQDNLTFIEVTNVQMSETKSSVTVKCTATYMDNDTNLILDMPYWLVLEKTSDNKFSIKELR